LRNAERGFRNIHRGNACFRSFMRYGNGNTAAARAEIQDIRWRTVRQFFERGVHQCFRIRSRDQYVRGHAELEPVKFPPADQIGNRLAASPAPNEFLKGFGHGWIGRIIAVRGKPGAGGPRYVAK